MTTKPLRRKDVGFIERGMIAYDLETTRIRAGESPAPIYATMYDGRDVYAAQTPDFASLGSFVETHMLTRGKAGARFVAWNGNRFDVYMVIKALITLNNGYTIEPMLAGSGALRGVTVRQGKRMWLFLDGMAMTYQQCNLATFVASFAPEYPKLVHDFTEAEFDPDSPEDRAYAERDVVGLWHAMMHAEDIVREFTGFPLMPTIGNLGIKYWQKMMPEGVTCWQHGKTLNDAVWDSLVRGGYCWTVRQYIGRVDKYDVNQAYAAAIRNVSFPHGSVYQCEYYMGGKPGIYCVSLSHRTRQTVPFYGRDPSDGRTFFTHGKPHICWVTSDEYKYLIQHRWDVRVHRGYFWAEHFTMKAMVDVLEDARMNAPGGPSSPRGLMIKAIGNHAYGKLAERLSGLEYCAANECPPGWSTIPGAPHLYMRARKQEPAVYHIPYLSCFITAYVRVQVMEAAHSVGSAFLYADTDSLIVVHGANPAITIDPKRYGAWKVEAIDAPYCIVGKKVYAEMKPKGVHCKGLHPGAITQCQMLAWYGGMPPEQMQVQRVSFGRFMRDQPMFQEMTRRGTNVDLLENVTLDDERRFFAR